MIYLDNAATTQPTDNVIQTISTSMRESWYNPSSAYAPGWETRKKINKAREVVAESINAQPEEIIFTSSGSEANNLALAIKPNVLYSSIEHASIIRNAKQRNNCEYAFCSNENGVIDKDHYFYVTNYAINNVKDCSEWVVSAQYVNNETGVIQPIKEMAQYAHRQNLLFHTDAVQAYPHMKIDVKDLGVDLMSVSGHKFGCPKGIGFLYVSNKCKDLITPIIYGSQEYGLRGGTENVPYILGLEEAVKSNSIQSSCSDIHLYLEQQLERIGCIINGKQANRIDTITSCTLPDGTVGEYVGFMLMKDGIYISHGSACNANSHMPSHVLLAMGFDKDYIQRTIRISISKYTTKEEIDIFIKTLKKILKL